MAQTLPAIFFGHGNPMNAISRNNYTEAWKSIGEGLPTPRAILCISAHWYIPNTAVTSNVRPRTIHDFGGFPRDLYQVQYPANGEPELAQRLERMLAPVNVALDDSWGLDHGTWAVLRHVYPKADIPVVQLSIDETQPAKFHYEVGKAIAGLREDGVLIVGSGNVVHNLHTYAWGHHTQEPFDWAVSFENTLRRALLTGDHGSVIDYEHSLGDEAVLAAPTPDHFLPLLYVIGTRAASDEVSFPVEGVDGGSISMLAVRVG
jgi:4,5-DOPA dioxygenase extradiol